MSLAQTLKVENLSIAFGGLKAVDDLSFHINEGEIYGLIGPNGAGKTTVFNCITQFYKPNTGKVIFKSVGNEDINLVEKNTHDIIRLGLVRTFQNVELIQDLSLLENLLIGAHISYKSGLFSNSFRTRKAKAEEKENIKKAEKILEFLGIENKEYELAGGQPYGILKKIELGRTLMSNPKLIILDEPAAGLNDTETLELAKLIRDIRDKYKCNILLVEHDMRLVMDICDRICAISFGRKLAEGTPKEIQSNKDVQEAYLGKDE
ncbi:ABC transporter ATP-binding protein [Clostridium tertium]|uniref:ABC transporter ATP-binding protein n=1 Tax=Clostridium tertium TaxID=1559 RepID=UPI001AE206B6|nr:ABC transporter ATP-binding protein [Clostridium tertium]MBP1867636.1 branched-chain amino acid transport system ATP-binding protein [Clostridium tertium]